MECILGAEGTGLGVVAGARRDRSMDNQQASEILERELESFRQEPYSELVRRIGLEPVVLERAGKGTTAFIVEIEFMWDGPEGGNVLVIGSVDDGGCRAFVPITRSFIRTPEDRSLETNCISMTFWLSVTLVSVIRLSNEPLYA